MEAYRVPYALAPDGRVVRPSEATRKRHDYTCPKCLTPVRRRAGLNVVATHFVHEVEPNVPCSPESVVHKAAKREFKHLLERIRAEGRTHASLHGAPCSGYTDAWGRHAPHQGNHCRDFELPAFDEAQEEEEFDGFYLDVAGVREGRAVLGVELRHTHAVDDVKAAHLKRVGLPWFEVYATAVLGPRPEGSSEPESWLVLRSSLDVVQCRQCQHRERKAEGKRRELQWRAHMAQQRARRRWIATTQFAADARGRVVQPGGMVPEPPLSCLGCRQVVRPARDEAGNPVFLHDPDLSEGCDPDLAMRRANMRATQRRLEHDARRVCLQRVCGECGSTFDEELPAFDSVRAVRVGEPMLLLSRRDGRRRRTVLQLDFHDLALPKSRAPQLHVTHARHSEGNVARLVTADDQGVCTACARQQRTAAQPLFSGSVRTGN